ncbi:putative triacylglycerol lipase [Dioscorea sansibarensis]
MAHNILLLFLFYLHAITLTCRTEGNEKSPKFSAILFFGDSTVDTGNNGHLPTLFRSNHHPYGRDFPSHTASGRFSNGRLVPDLLSSALGLNDHLPPFLDSDLTTSDLRTGVSFASAGSGFDDVTSALSRTMTMSRQVKMFESYIDKLKKIAGDAEVNNIISDSLIVTSAGTNDMILNFYDIPTRKLEFNITEYQDFLLRKFHDIIMDIYKLGGRKFIIAGLPPIGCIPVQMTLKFKRQSESVCIDEQNIDAFIYNSKLQALLPQIQQTLPGSLFAYQDLFDELMKILKEPEKYGFKETKKGCCGAGLFEIGPLCNTMTSLCDDVSSYVFFDAIHPTERVYGQITHYMMEHVIPLFGK